MINKSENYYVFLPESNHARSAMFCGGKSIPIHTEGDFACLPLSHIYMGADPLSAGGGLPPPPLAG